MEKNSNYVFQNLEFAMSTTYWQSYIEHFFGKQQAEEFYEYLIQAHHIMRKNDLRKIISDVSLSISSLSITEQLALVSIYHPIDRNSHFIQKTEDGFKKAQKLYQTKNIQLSKKIKKLGYSFTTIDGNWKDKTERDVYQREKIFVIFGEQENPLKFKNDICNLVKEYHIHSVLITDALENNEPKTKIVSKLLDTTTGNELEVFHDTTQEVVENYFTNLHNTKFLFKIPYENNKKILALEETKKLEYYSPKKQELVRNSKVYSCNRGMYKQFLLQAFSNPNYNH